MDNIFRTKKFRETASRSNASDTVSGTLDSLHQNIINNIKDSDVDDIRERISEIKLKINESNLDKSIESILATTKLQIELNELEHVLSDKSPVENYYLKNADIMLKYYGIQEKTQFNSAAPQNQNTFLKYLTPSNTADTSCVSKKELFEQYAKRMKLNTISSAEINSQGLSEQCVK